MRKKNGFAIAGVLYPLLVLFLVFVFLILGSLMGTNIQYKKITSDIQAKINGESKITLPYYEAPSPTDTHLGIIYLDPTDLNKTCTKAEAESNLQGKDKNGTTTLTGTKTGCMKWYIFKRTGDTLSLILDHNTTARSIYDFQNKNSYSNGKVDDPYEVWWELNELVTTSGWKVTPRLITGQEIADISGNTNFNEKTSPSSAWAYIGSNAQTVTNTQRQPYAWLFDNLYDSISYGGTKNERGKYFHLNANGESVPQSDGSNREFADGYWTSSPVASSSNYVWFVGMDANLYPHNAYFTWHGIRPVIEISTKGTKVGTNLVQYIESLYRQKSPQLSYDNTADNNLRYIGSNPNNYVSFNNELWRMIGVMSNIGGDGNQEKRVKLMREESLGLKKWNEVNENNWETSTLANYLNQDYLNQMSSSSRILIGKAKWNISRFNYSNSAYTYYISERANSNVPSNVWEGVVGLYSPSDYGFATGGNNKEVCLNAVLYERLVNGFDNYYIGVDGCLENNWLYDQNETWFMNAGNAGSRIMFLYPRGYIDFGGNHSTPTVDLNYYPTVYLRNDVSLISGNGTRQNPYKIN